MSAFEVYALDTPQAARTIKGKLEKARADLVSVLAAPNTVKDWADYRHRVGVIEGIDEALRVCDDLDKEAEKRR